MHQPAPGSTATLGSVISSEGTLNKETEAQISKTCQLFGHLCSHVMRHRNIKVTTKIKMYKAVLLTSLLFGYEMLILYRECNKQLEHFQMRSQRSIIGIKWQDRVTNIVEVLERSRLPSIEAMILRAQLHWTCHVI